MMAPSTVRPSTIRMFASVACMMARSATLARSNEMMPAMMPTSARPRKAARPFLVTERLLNITTCPSAGSAADDGLAPHQLGQVDFDGGGADGLVSAFIRDRQIELGAPDIQLPIPLGFVDEDRVRTERKGFLKLRLVALPVI